MKYINDVVNNYFISSSTFLCKSFIDFNILYTYDFCRCYDGDVYHVDVQKNDGEVYKWE